MTLQTPNNQEHKRKEQDAREPLIRQLHAAHAASCWFRRGVHVQSRAERREIRGHKPETFRRKGQVSPGRVASAMHG